MQVLRAFDLADGDQPGRPHVRMMSFSNRGLDVRMLRRPKAVKAFQRRGHQVYVWTVDRHEDVDRCLELGVDVIITNRPGHVLRQVARSG